MTVRKEEGIGNLKGKALDRTALKSCYGRHYGPVASKTN